ncbi:hypothetical protein [Phytohabitans rumicis]|uniref:Peptidase M23 n=1 Tax=Phytohabitans rumicis TaxID=1076125 RepID=A0A6V8LJH3_9ACTN|nr:hypothetical protein [Phytohabitans rumicis]GFJ92765.1 hypothetical protein Prum_064070 [Phytohabitans rumicis]
MRDDDKKIPQNAATATPNRSADGTSTGKHRLHTQSWHTVARERATQWATELPAWLRTRSWPSFSDQFSGRRLRLAVATSVIGALGFAAVAENVATTDAVTSVSPAAAAQAQVAERAQAQQAASRSQRVQAEAAAKAKKDAAAKAAAAKAAADKKAAAQKAAAAAAAAAKSPAHVAPVGSLTQVQMDNAQAIVQTGLNLGVPQRGLVIAVATAMQESTLLNRASEVLPESYQYTHQGTGSDHDSVGLFQQRPSSGWGSVANLMKPEYAATAFYRVLLQVPGWQGMALTYAAQAVQVSAYPEAYAKHEGGAAWIVSTLLKAGVKAQ